MNRPARTSQARSFWLLRAGVAAGLLVSAVIHFQLAPGYQRAAPGGIGQGTLFLVQAGVSFLAAVFVLFKGTRTAFAAAAVVAVSSLAAALLYRYVQSPLSDRCLPCMNRSGTRPKLPLPSPKPPLLDWH